MKVLELTRYFARPWASTQPFQIAAGEDPTPKTPHITVEFTHPEFEQLANLVYHRARGSSGLGQEILALAEEAGLKYTETDIESSMLPLEFG